MPFGMNQSDMKSPLFFFLSLGFAPALLAQSVDWKPQFNDRPVSDEDAAKIRQAVPQEPIVDPQQPRRLLVFSATSGFRHRSIPHGKLALDVMGEQTGAYEAVISDDPANFEIEALRQFDAVALVSPTQDFFMPPKNQRESFSDEEWQALQNRHNRLVDNLIDFIEAGGGLVGIHAATDACYGHEEYGETIGGYFWGHPWRAGNNVTIVVEDPDHAVNKPVFGDMRHFSFKEEIYQFRPEPFSRERLRILLHLDPERSDDVGGKRREDNDYPVAWVQSVGEGRVFYSSIGHNEHIYWNPLMLKHYLAGIQFAFGDLKADTTPSAKVAVPNVGEERQSLEDDQASANGWIRLFDGHSLEGWSVKNGFAKYKVRNGTIVGTSALASPNTFLCTERTFGDFVLEFEVKCGEINSGVQIRSREGGDHPEGRVNGPQVEIEHSPGQAGYIYGEAYAGWISPEPKSDDRSVSQHNHFKNEGWNHYRVVAVGDRIATWINGTKIADVYDPENLGSHPEGFIGLQVHSHLKPGVEIAWRNLRLREL